MGYRTLLGGGVLNAVFIPSNADCRELLYQESLARCRRFCNINNIGEPTFLKYSEIDQCPNAHVRLFMRKVMGGPTVGSGTGYYHPEDRGYVFVNLPRTALPVHRPMKMSWSYPGWKTDRTAYGVPAHEVGHHAEVQLKKMGRLDVRRGEEWRELIQRVKKQVTSYEPVPSEAWAETIRLFITNPDLLMRGIPERYGFCLSVGLKPVELTPWESVINNHQPM